MEEPSEDDAGLSPLKEKKEETRKVFFGFVFVFFTVLRKFQPGLWTVHKPKSPFRGGQHLTGMNMRSIPASLGHWLGEAIGKHSLHANVVIDFRGQQLVCESIKGKLRDVFSWPPQASVYAAKIYVSS